MQRFYKSVSVTPPHAASGFLVMLDNRPVKTPARQSLRLPSAALAQAVSAEWDAQQDQITPANMPLTQIAATALDRVAPNAQVYASRIAAYGETDLVCYRADSPQELVARQSETWQPLVDWVADEFSAPLMVTDGVAPVVQPAETLAALSEAVSAHDPFEMAALGLAAAACGSLVIALALSRRRLDCDAACAASFLDEIWQAEQWGDDADAKARRLAAQRDIEAAAHFFALCRES